MPPQPVTCEMAILRQLCSDVHLGGQRKPMVRESHSSSCPVPLWYAGRTAANAKRLYPHCRSERFLEYCEARRETRELCGCSSPHPFDGVPGIAANSTLSLIQLKNETGEFYDLREKRLDITNYYLALAGGTMPFIRRYSTI
jgi:hypothetical protein